MEKGMQLLFSCLKKNDPASRLDHIMRYGEAEWDIVMERAAGHNILPILYYKLKDDLPNLAIPEPVFNKLRDAYHGSAKRNMKLYSQLFQTVHKCRDAGVEVILLKGAHLAEAIYGNIALRPMSDIDLLARKEELGRIITVLLNDGYTLKSVKSLSSTKHLPPYFKESKIPLEIHFHITDPTYAGRMSLEQIWERSQVVTFQNTKVRVLSLEDLYIHLCMHGAIQHGLETGLITCFDVDFLLERYDNRLDWNYIWKRGSELGVVKALCLLPALNERLLNVELPEDIAKKKLPTKDFQLALELAEGLICDRGRVFNRNIARLFDAGSFKKKIIYFRKQTFPPRETVIEGASGAGANNSLNMTRLYTRHIKGLLREHGSTMWQAIKKDPKTRIALNRQNDRNRLRDMLIDENRAD